MSALPWLLLPAAVVAAGAGFERVRRMTDRRRHPAPARFEDVGGHRLHHRVLGDGEDLVVLEAGSGDWSTHWGRVPELLARDATVLIYDRAGLGWSEAGPSPRSAEIAAQELHQLLQRIAPGGRPLLVAHGRGAAIARIYAHRYPFEPTGLVLVDPEPPGLDDELRQRGIPSPHASPLFWRLLVAANAVGVARLLGWHPAVPVVENLALTEREQAALVARGHDPRVLRTMGAELEQRAVDEARVRELRSRFNGPVRVVSAEATLAPDAAPRGCSPEEFNVIWQTSQEPYLQFADDSVRTVVPGSHHHVALHAPEAVVDVVREALQASRSVGEPV